MLLRRRFPRARFFDLLDTELTAELTVRPGLFRERLLANPAKTVVVDEVQKVKRAARVDPAQGELLPSMPPVVAPRELPVRFQVDLTPEQEARRSALVERLHKMGGVPSDRAELILEALAVLVEMQ